MKILNIGIYYSVTVFYTCMLMEHLQKDLFKLNMIKAKKIWMQINTNFDGQKTFDFMGWKWFLFSICEALHSILENCTADRTVPPPRRCTEWHDFWSRLWRFQTLRGSRGSRLFWPAVRRSACQVVTRAKRYQSKI